MLYKGISEGVKDLDTKQGIVTGYLAHFGSKDSDGDIIVEGAFQKSISENGPNAKQLIKHLLDHNKTQAIGKFTELKEDQTGLYYESKIGRHTLGRDFLLMVEDGIINQHSIGYIPTKNKQKGNTNFIHEVVLREGSSLQFLGANHNTPITGIKELKLDEINTRMILLEKSIRVGAYSDETIAQLMTELEEIKSLVKSLNHQEPAEDVTPGDEPIDKSELINHIKKSFSFN